MPKKILLIGAFDTKGEEFVYARDLIVRRGHHVLLTDVGVLEDPVNLQPDISSAEVAKAGGSSLQKLRSTGDRGQAIDVMIAGVEKIVPQLYSEQRFDAVLSLGGGAGTNIATAGMRQLPVGVPKVMVSTLASSDVSSYVGVKDITMMYSVTDIAGLNRLSRQVLANAVGAVCGMAEQVAPAAEDKPLIAASMFGVTTPCVSEVRKKLEKAGYELLVFHATGTGGRAMEGLIEDGFFAAVADITTTEWADQVVGGVLPAGEDRLGAAGRKGIPQVVSCGALDMVNFHAMETVPQQFKGRNLYKHNPTVTLMRTTADECRKIGNKIAGKLNQANGPVTLILPLKGVSSLDADGQPFFDSETDEALFDSLRESVSTNVNVVELDLHINDPEFADRIAEELLSML
ncbi:Tm-1-like ATP-binding domain-containing protein [Rhodohalobacter sulfatireducens]|uniref:Tm-1-like ATP-binding domain-containing protein n=1 Tax=Rhodohalobacter sulfatireducens TaxID=2911366 RepID=A0ABS9KHC2_9BACT|nr:Tm-1-like ATP-binding domain-containing protein [Rhodohalobacter sulfatireducens]MCG2590225.1 Tm-1-like ATP-binding domain-containing protein [Rhodohalobacter sulfatireducens]